MYVGKHCQKTKDLNFGAPYPRRRTRTNLDIKGAPANLFSLLGLKSYKRHIYEFFGCCGFFCFFKLTLLTLISEVRIDRLAH